MDIAGGADYHQPDIDRTIWLHFANKGAGAFFFHERPGKDGIIFKVIKFKTLTDEQNFERDFCLMQNI